MKNSQLNLKNALVFASLMFLALIFLVYKQDAMLRFRQFLEWKYLGGVLWAYILISLGLDYYTFGRYKEGAEGGLILSHFGPLADSVSGVITYGLATTTATSLLKGVYIQKVFGDITYFKEFDSIDIYSILVVCVFLVWYSLFRVTTRLIAVLYYNDVERAVAVDAPQ